MKENIANFFRKNIASIYIAVILAGLPLYTHDMLYDISDAKYKFFMYTTIGFLLIWIIVYNKKLKELFEIKWEKNDMFYAAFLLCALFSTLGSVYPKKAFTGEAGRHIGLFTYLLECAAFLMIITAPIIKKYVLYLWSISTVIVGIIGILNHFGMDPLGFFSEMYDEQIPLFMSTMGNVDFFSGYMAFVFVFFSMLCIKTTKKSEVILGGITAAVSVFAVNATKAETGYIMIICFVIYGWLLVDKISELAKYCGCSTLIFFTSKVIGRIDNKISKARELDGIGSFLSDSKITTVLSVIYVFGTAIFLYAAYKRKKQNADYENDIKEELCDQIEEAVCNNTIDWKKVKNIATKMVSVMTISGISVIAFVNLLPLNIAQDSILYNIKITDDFGSTRGYVWRKTIEYFNALPVENKIWGIGPDLGIFAYDKILYVNPAVELPATFDNAHNVTLQLLLTHGILGVITYFGFILSSVIEMLKRRREYYMMGVIGFTIISYIFMMQVCVNVIYLTAMPFIIFCIGKKICYERRNK